MQSRRMSFVEALTNVGVGYILAAITTALVLPAFGYDVSAPDALGISAVFTCLSLARGYLLRRVFNRVKA